MTYFTGLKFRRTERMHSAVLPARGDIVYISPAFEVEKLKTMTSFGETIAVWEEDEDPTATVTETVRALGYPSGTIAVDEAHAVLHLRRPAPRRQRLYLRQRDRRHRRLPHDQVRAGNRADADRQEHHPGSHKAAARIMREGITTTEVQAFITAAHRKLARKAIRRSTRYCSARPRPIRTACPIRRL